MHLKASKKRCPVFEALVLDRP